MANYLTLTCPSCGGNLEIEQYVDEFACPFCGREHVLYIRVVPVELKPSEGEDDINPLYKKYEALTARKDVLHEEHPYPKSYAAPLIFTGAAFILFVLLYFFGAFTIRAAVMLLLGIIIFLVGVAMNGKYVRDKTWYETDFMTEINELDEQISQVQADIEQVELNEA